MEQISQLESTPTLENVLEQFEAWRQNRVKRSAIPDVLWQAAVNLCQEYTISKVCSTLRLNYADLKQRVHVYVSSQPIQYMTPSNFIELNMGLSKVAPECIIEISDQKGATMRMHVKGDSGLDILAFGKAFWNKRP